MPTQGTRGRPISHRYKPLLASCHENTLFVIVSPDSATASTQAPQALRVYCLDLQTLEWSLVSPGRHDGPDAVMPIPRSGAACFRKGDKVFVCTHLCCCVSVDGCPAASKLEFNRIVIRTSMLEMLLWMFATLPRPHNQPNVAPP
jgi:hypothetical protein